MNRKKTLATYNTEPQKSPEEMIKDLMEGARLIQKSTEEKKTKRISHKPLSDTEKIEIAIKRNMTCLVHPKNAHRVSEYPHEVLVSEHAPEEGIFLLDKKNFYSFFSGIMATDDLPCS